MAVDWSSVHGVGAPGLRPARAADHRGSRRGASAGPASAPSGCILRRCPGDGVSVARPSPPATSGTPWGAADRAGSLSAPARFGTVYRAIDPDARPTRRAEARVRLSADSPRSPAAAIDPRRSVAGSSAARERHHVHGALEINGEVGIWMDFVRGRRSAAHHQGRRSDERAGGDGRRGEPVSRPRGQSIKPGLIHRDIRRRNVMREAGGRIVMLDFGAGTGGLGRKFPGEVRVAGTHAVHGAGAVRAAGGLVTAAISTASVCCCSISSPASIRCGDNRSHKSVTRTWLGAGARSPDTTARSAGPFHPGRLRPRVVACAERPLSERRRDAASSRARTTRRRPARPRRTIKFVALSSCGAAFGAMMLGAISSGAFNLWLERSPVRDRHAVGLVDHQVRSTRHPDSVHARIDRDRARRFDTVCCSVKFFAPFAQAGPYADHARQGSGHQRVG